MTTVKGNGMHQAFPKQEAAFNRDPGGHQNTSGPMSRRKILCLSSVVRCLSSRLWVKGRPYDFCPISRSIFKEVQEKLSSEI